MKWIKDGLSMDETKISAIIIAFFITLAVALHQVTVVGDISDNLLMLLMYELGAFTGIKVAETFTTVGKKKMPVVEFDYSNTQESDTKKVDTDTSTSTKLP